MSEHNSSREPETSSQAEEQNTGSVPAEMGIERYVQAAFFAVASLTGFLLGKFLGGIWNAAADTPWMIERVPALLNYSEDERPVFTMTAGFIIGVLYIFRLARRSGVRKWANEVAIELAKVYWPERSVVTHGTVVVLATGIIATVYIAVIDRLWAFLTSIVYGVNGAV